MPNPFGVPLGFASPTPLTMIEPTSPSFTSTGS